MRHLHTTALSIVVFSSVQFHTASAQQLFPGTNAPGQATNFSFNIGSGATNLSLVISNSAAAYSYLLLKPGGTPTDTDFTYAARVAGQTNRINLELPEFASGDYGLRVSTPAASGTHPFQVILTTNRTDLRSAAYPVLKPLAFSTTGLLTNTGSGAWHYFQVDMPSNLLTGWRLVLSTNAPGGNPNLYVRRGTLPTTSSSDKASVNQMLDTLIFRSNEATNSTYFVGVHLPGAASVADYRLSAELASVTTLTWDPGTTDSGTQVFTNTSTTGGDYYFAITTAGTVNNVWRTALKVLSGEADVYLLQGNLPSTTSYNYASTLVGSDGMVLTRSGQFSEAQNWYYLVRATPGAQWTLVSGEAYVQQLPALAADASSGAAATVGPEGMRYFKTTISPGTLAWRLGLNGLTNLLYVGKSAAPHPYSTYTYDLRQPGQMLVVPTYLNSGDQYYVGVAGVPGTAFTLDSRRQGVTDLAFNSVTNFSVSDYGYVTFRVQVPIQQIAWQLNLLPSAGEPDIAIRRDNVANEFVNDAFSAAGGSTPDSVTLVPAPPSSPPSAPGLQDGTYYVTVYGTPPYTCSLTNGNPIVTDVHYVFQVTNDAPSRVGWRFYRIADTAEQLGSLGWQLDLSNQPAGTEIAIRRNAVPGRWNYRNSPYGSPSYSTVGYVDLSSTTGFIQEPNHQADIWYIGVYSPTAPLGAFTLAGTDMTGPPIGFDGNGAVTNVTGQPVGKFYYFRVDVPAEALGWDLRLTNVTSGDPRLVVRRDRLPDSLSTHDATIYGWGPTSSSTWPSGYQWAPSIDWTGYGYDANGTNRYGHVLAMGMGNPLQPGTYYVGVLNSTGPGYQNPMSYTLVSRGIGAGLSISVADLPFTNGTLSASLVPREAAYYRVTVPDNLPGWKLRLGADSGESMLMLQRNALPNIGASGSSPLNLYGGRQLQKAGSEQYLFLPTSGATNITAGTYYLAVASEGMNPGGSRIGTNVSSFTLTSFGVPNIANLGTLDVTGATDILHTNSNEGGEIKHFQFSVPAGTLAMEVWLENRTGNPMMSLRADSNLPRGTDSYGQDGGQSYTWNDPDLINIANPAPTNYTLGVQAAYSGGTYPAAAYRIRVHALTSQPVPFDPGVLSVSGHPSGTWRYYTITVPSENVVGWDLRLTNVTSGDPRLVVRRDLAPDSLNTHDATIYGWSPTSSSTWPSAYQWAPSIDWTGWGYDANGANQYGHVLATGMGNPLQPGTYIVGVINSSGTGYLNPMSYTLVSRGIGTNLSIGIVDLPFTNGTASATLAPREAAYYRINVPTNLPNWKLKLAAGAGESTLMLQRNALPNIGASGSSPVTLNGGRQLQKAGDEQYLLMASSGATNISSGTYFLAVASEGMNPSGSRIGTNASSFTLTSYGVLGSTDLGTVDFTGVTDILHTNSNEGGEIKMFHFSVPPGTLNLEVRLEDRVGNPWMTLRTGDFMLRGYDSYGQDGGVSATWSDNDLINLANPAATNYTLTVQAVSSSGAYPAASYRIRIHATGPLPVNFDNGSSTIVGQPSGTWQYFAINIPAGALGWDLRLTNVLSGDPRLVVRRDIAPDGLSTHDATVYGWNPGTSSTWPSAYQWAPGLDWTGYNYDANRTNQYGHVLATGMGNPLQPGTYIVGVFNGSGSGYLNPMSYTLISRCIGNGLAIPVYDLAFTNGTASYSGLPGREAVYYRVEVPTNLPNWKLRLTTTSGESTFALQKDALPSILAAGSSPITLTGGRQLQKSGNEQYLLLPSSGAANIPGGTYYLLVASEGMNPSGSYLGTNTSAFTISSYGVLAVTNMGTVGALDLLQTNTLQGGETALYRFTIPPGLAAVEVRLEGRSGNPYITMAMGTNAPRAQDAYGYNGGINPGWSSGTLITLPNPIATNYTVVVQGSYLSGAYPDASYVLRVREMPTPVLNFAANLNTNGFSNVATGTLSDGQSAFYQVTVPAVNNGQPVIGWKLSLSQLAGTPRLRIRKDTIPNDDYYGGTSGFIAGTAVFVPPYLTPGVWYVEVRGTGQTSYTLTSGEVGVERGPWNMPVEGNPVTTPGLPAAGPLFGDTGVDTNGVALPADGIDLAQGDFHFYSVAVPPGNIGVLRTRLDAISGDPDLYIRFGAPPTLNHNANGQSGTLYDRALTANVGSEYGNWVPLSGRYESYLPEGTWYLAVQAGGNSNVRYRLRLFTGIVNNLSLNNGSYPNQVLAAGDWLYYRVELPTNAPVNWNVTFSQQLGDVVMYVRDRVPPGQATTVTDYRHWGSSADNKNHSTYSTFDPPGTYTLSTPPLRPGNSYFLGFRAVNDATFSVSCSTNGGYIDYTNTIPFYGGSLVTTVPANGTLKLRLDVPPDARRLILRGTNVSPFNLYLDQGSVPTRTTGDHWYSAGSANPVLNQALYNANGWPWLPNYMYFLYVTNTSASPQQLALGADGRNCATDDSDNDSLPDCWELTYWPGVGYYNGTQDPDGDGVRNSDEYLEGTDPTSPLSVHPRLLITAVNGTVDLNPAGNPTTTPPKVWYELGQVVQLTGVGAPGYDFAGWSGDAAGTQNPLSITMTNHKSITAVFFVTNQPNADYQFQNNLHSSVGTPPDLTNILAGNTFVTDTVDGVTRTVYRFPQGSGVALAPADGVIPTNVYTMVLLFRFDTVSGWRRILDVKNPPSNFGLYQVNGVLSFYGSAQGTAASIVASNYVQVVMTRDAQSNVVCYVNGVRQFSFVDSQFRATLSGSPQMLRFFKDESTEDGYGAIARIRLYDRVMPIEQIVALDRIPGGSPMAARFGTPYLSGGVLQLPAEVSPGFTYRLLASTNLVNWVIISTNVPSGSPYPFTDPLGPALPQRFYRLVTP